MISQVLSKRPLNTSAGHNESLVSGTAASRATFKFNVLMHSIAEVKAYGLL